MHEFQLWFWCSHWCDCEIKTGFRCLVVRFLPLWRSLVGSWLQKGPVFPSWHLPEARGRAFCVCFNWKLIVKGVAMEILPALEDTSSATTRVHPPSPDTFFCMRSRAAAGIVCPHWPCGPKPCEMRRKKREGVKWETNGIKPDMSENWE